MSVGKNAGWRFGTVIVIALLAVGAASALVIRHRSAPPWEHRNVILIGWDAADSGVVTMLLAQRKLPHLEGLAAQGGFAYTAVTTGRTETKPGWAEILTGYAAPSMGIFDNKKYGPIPEGLTVFERLRSRYGRRVANIFIGGKTNNIGSRGPHEACMNCPTRTLDTHEKTAWWDRSLFKGMGENNQPPRWEPRAGEPFFNAVKVVDRYESSLGGADKVGQRFIAALDDYRDRSFFAFVHFEEPDEQGHHSGRDSAEFEDGLVLADVWLGRILDKLDALQIRDHTYVFVASDHGFDAIGLEHFTAPDTILVSGSGKPEYGDRKDIAPTVLATFGIDPTTLSPPLEGRNLIPRDDIP